MARSRKDAEVTVASDDEPAGDPFTAIADALVAAFKVPPLPGLREPDSRTYYQNRRTFFIEGAPVRIGVAPKRLRGRFRDDTTPEVTVECGRPSGYYGRRGEGDLFPRDVCVRYRAGARGWNVAGIVKFAMEVRGRYLRAAEQVEAEKEAEEARRAQARADIKRMKVDPLAAGFIAHRQVDGTWWLEPIMSMGRGLSLTDRGLPEFVKLMQRERAATDKMKAKFRAREPGS